MPGTCLYSWQTDASDPTVACIWHSSDYVERGIFIALALMLAYTVFVVIRFARRSYLMRREIRGFDPDDFSAIRRATLSFIAEMCPGIGMLKGIASAAPFLGLAGTSYGILGALFVGFSFSASRERFEAILSSQIAGSLFACVAGILVAVPATLAYNIVRLRVGSLSVRTRRSGLRFFRFAQMLPLQQRFSVLPPFALMAAPTLACIVALFTLFHPYQFPTGLAVRLPSFRCQDEGDNRRRVLFITSAGAPLINMEPTNWEKLPSQLSAIYRQTQYRELYLYAEDGVPFQTVADAIDVARNSPVAGQGSLDIKVILITPEADRECGVVPARALPLRDAPN